MTMSDRAITPAAARVPATTAAMLLALAMLAGCQTSTGPTASMPAPHERPLPSGYTCCNLHYENDWISDSNYGGLPMIELGTPAQVKGYGRYRVTTEIGGRPMWLGLDYGRDEPLEKFAAKLIVPDDPKRKLATYPPAVQRAIKAGQLSVGMTKEQVLMAVGYPLTSETSSLNLPVWRYWLGSFDEYQVAWDANDRAREIIGSATVLSRIVYKP
ncbi:MAG: hypothetical protein QM766_03470 [Burkholderiaceae bacterium]